MKANPHSPSVSSSLQMLVVMRMLSQLLAGIFRWPTLSVCLILGPRHRQLATDPAGLVSVNTSVGQRTKHASAVKLLFVKRSEDDGIVDNCLLLNP